MIPLSSIIIIFTVLIGGYLAWQQQGKLWAFLLLSSVASIPVLTVPGVPFSLRIFQILTLVFALVLLVRGQLVWPQLRTLIVIGALGALSIGALALLGGFFPMQHAKEVVSLCLLALAMVVALVSMRTILVTPEHAAGVSRILLSALGILAIVENLAFEVAQNFSVMPGRPNALLPEADWFGGVLAVLLIAALPAVFHPVTGYRQRVCQILPVLLGTIALILTVSRSAWLAYAAGLICLCILSYRAVGDIRKWALGTVSIALISTAAYAIVSTSHLTRFPLLQRAASTVTGEQIVTLACPPGATPPETVNVADSGTLGGCAHITLEERSTRAAAGYAIYERPQSDPNIQTRARIYQSVFAAWVAAPVAHQVFGFGFGSSTNMLGVDGRGEQLNASNIFLEVLYSTGVLGLGILLTLLILVVRRAVVWTLVDDDRAPVLVAVLATTVIFSLFNATYLLLTPLIFIFILYHTQSSFKSL